MTRQTTGRHLGPRAIRLALIALLAAFTLPGCGKKGPPLAPFVRVPARPDPFVARRLGSTVYIQVKIPAANADGTSPASIERVDVYGFTGSPDGNEDIFKYGTLVASIPVRKPPEDETTTPAKRKGGKPVKPAERPPAPPRPPASMETGFDQGDLVVVTEPLGPAQFAEVIPKKKKVPKVVAPVVKDVPVALGPAPRAPLPSRLYVAVGVSRKGQKGTISGRQPVLLTEPASAPGTPEITYSATAFTVTWTPPADAWAPAPGAAEGSPLKSTPIGTLPITGAFNVYGFDALPKPTAPAPAGKASGTPPPPLPAATGGRLPTPLNEKPVSAPSYVDSRMEFGKPRCYAVRAVTLFGTQAVEGESSTTTCVTPVDTFAPAAPTSLKAIGSQGAINLVWDANTEADLAGYIVLRAALPGSDFAALTPQPVKEASYTDSTAAPGRRYAYVVVAVDNAGNRSLRSNQVEEVAR